jgi:hypothetical protein
MTADLAAASYDVMLGPGGFFCDAGMKEEGVAQVLRLRSRYAAGRRLLSDARKYIDLRYWASAQE